MAQNASLSKADPTSIYQSAAIAATLDLPINQSLGFAWIVPYGQKQKDDKGNWVTKTVAQFQMGYKGFVQLAQRTGQYEKLNVIPVHHNQFKSFNSLYEELDCDFSIAGDGNIVGYVAYMKTVTGFNKLVYWDKATVDAHAKRYSQAYRDDKNTPWKTDFDKMAMKTVLKDMLSHWGPMSIELRQAIDADQSVPGEKGPQYPDNEPADDSPKEQSKEFKRIMFVMEDMTTTKDLEEFMSQIDLSTFSELESKQIADASANLFIKLQESGK